MQNEATETQIYIWNTGSVEQRHTTLLLICELFDAQSYPSKNVNELSNIRECIGLLNSMINSGEAHTNSSLEVVANAKTAISKIEALVYEQSHREDYE